MYRVARYLCVLVVLCAIIYVPMRNRATQVTLAASPPSQQYVLRFNGTKIAVAPSASGLNLGNQFTIETWLYLDATVPNRIVLGRARDPRGGDPNTNYTIETAGNGLSLIFIQSTGQPGSARFVQTPTRL